MQKEHGKTHKTMRTRVKKLGLGFKSLGLTLKKSVVGTLHMVKRVGVGSFAAVGKAAIFAGKQINKAMKFTIIASIFVGILQSLEQIRKFPYSFMQNMIEAVVEIGKTFQMLVNAVFFGFNKMGNAFRGIFGLDKKDQFQLNLIDEDTASNLMKGLESNALTKGVMKSAKEMEAASVKADKYTEAIKKIGEMSQTVAEDLKAIIEGLNDLPKGAAKSLQKMTAIGSAGVSGLIQRALDSATSRIKVGGMFGREEDVIDQEQAQAGLDEIINKLGARIKRISPELRNALNAPIEEALQKVQRMETQALEFTSATKQMGAQVEQIQSNLGGKNFEATLEMTDPLVAVRDRLIDIGKATNEVTKAQELMDEAFGFAGGLNAYREQITNLIQEEERLKGTRTALAVLSANTALLSGGFVQQEQERIGVQKSRLAVEENLLKIEKAQFLLREAEAAVGENKSVEKITELEKEITTLQRLGVELQNNADIAESNANDINKIGKTIGQSLQDNLSGAFNALVQGTKSFKDAFKDMAKAILADIAQMITKMLVMRMLTSAFGGTGFGDFIGLPAPGAKKGGILEPPQYRYGGIARMEDYSRGGVARGKQSGYPAVLHGTEAVVPLPDNRSIPVEMKGGMGQQNNVTVNVSIDGNGQSQQQNSQSDGAMGENLGRLIASAVQDELHFQKRSGGILNPYGVA